LAVILFASDEQKRGDSMRPKERRDSGQNDLFKARLDQIVDMNHALAKLAQAVNWGFLEKSFGAVYADIPGRPPLPTRLMAGLAILKHMHNLSDEVLCERWVENPYYQLFCGEEFFRHKLSFDRSSLTRWRQRMGEEKLVALIQESLSVATRTGAAKPSDFSKVIVDTTVQEKAVAFPTDAKLMHRARECLVRLAKKHGIGLRQSYARVGKHALIAISATPTPSSSSGRTRRCARSGLILAASSATSPAGSGATRHGVMSSAGLYGSPCACASSAKTSAAGRSIACTRRRSNASARARHTSAMNLG
jgi:hypothetical protein